MSILKAELILMSIPERIEGIDPGKITLAIAEGQVNSKFRISGRYFSIVCSTLSIVTTRVGTAETRKTMKIDAASVMPQIIVINGVSAVIGIALKQLIEPMRRSFIFLFSPIKVPRAIENGIEIERPIASLERLASTSISISFDVVHVFTNDAAICSIVGK